MRLTLSALLALAAALVLSGSAVAHKERVDVGPLPTCGVVPGEGACLAAWAEVDDSALWGCLFYIEQCGDLTCTLDMPPSRCGNDVVALGLAFRPG